MTSRVAAILLSASLVACATEVDGGRDGGVTRDGGATPDSGVSDDASTPDDASTSDDATVSVDADASPMTDGSVTRDAGTPPACQTRITYGSRWIHPADHPSDQDVVPGRIGWGGECRNDGEDSVAVLSDGTRARFRGHHSCIIALDHEGCAGAEAACATRVHYGPRWLSDRTTRYDDRDGVIGWSGVCHTEGGISTAALSNGWRPRFDAPECQLSFRFTQCGGLYTNDVIQGCADPGVTYDPDGDRFILSCTGGNFPIYVSRDLVSWTRRGTIFTDGTRPSWRTTSGDARFWAPEIHRVADGRCVAYYTATHRDGSSAIGAAEADNPLGPFRDIGEPLVRGPGPGFIDPSYVRDTDGQRYVVYKYAGLRTGERTPIYIQPIGPRGVATTGTAVRILTNDPSTWEGGSVEGASILIRGGDYYIFYSGGAFDSDRYAVGVARARSIHGPYTRLGRPILGTNWKWTGPGHGSPVPLRTGGWAYVYHAWNPPPDATGARRNVLVDRIEWSDGWPAIPAGPSIISMPPPR